MSWISLVLAWMYFPFKSSVSAFPEKTETLDRNQTWKLALKKIDELQKIVKFQEDRITSLERRSRESTIEFAELQNIPKNQCCRMTQLETRRVIELETLFKEEKDF